jgi:TadE-like protein
MSSSEVHAVLARGLRRARTAITTYPRGNAGDPADAGCGRTTDARTGRTADAGYVTAEAAVALPVLAVFTMGLLWALLAVAAQIQCVDAARAGARAAARQDPYEAVMAAAGQAAPKGAEITIRREGDLVRVSVAADTPGPAAFALRLHQDAVAMAEDTVGTGVPEEPLADGFGPYRTPAPGTGPPEQDADIGPPSGRGARTGPLARTAHTGPPERAARTGPPGRTARTGPSEDEAAPGRTGS